MSTPLPPAPEAPKPAASKPIWKHWWFWVAVLVVVGIAIGSVGQDGGDKGTTAPEETAATDEQVCSEFRDVAAGAFGESLSKSEIAAKVEEIGRLAKDASAPDIRSNALAIAKDPQTTAVVLINGDPDAAADALAEECNARYPI